MKKNKIVSTLLLSAACFCMESLNSPVMAGDEGVTPDAMGGNSSELRDADAAEEVDARTNQEEDGAARQQPELRPLARSAAEREVEELRPQEAAHENGYRRDLVQDSQERSKQMREEEEEEAKAKEEDQAYLDRLQKEVDDASFGNLDNAKARLENAKKIIAKLEEDRALKTRRKRSVRTEKFEPGRHTAARAITERRQKQIAETRKEAAHAAEAAREAKAREVTIREEAEVHAKMKALEAAERRAALEREAAEHAHLADHEADDAMNVHRNAAAEDLRRESAARKIQKSYRDMKATLKAEDDEAEAEAREAAEAARLADPRKAVHNAAVNKSRGL